jgi:hypothetical protein
MADACEVDGFTNFMHSIVAVDSSIQGLTLFVFYPHIQQACSERICKQNIKWETEYSLPTSLNTRKHVKFPFFLGFGTLWGSLKPHTQVSGLIYFQAQFGAIPSRKSPYVIKKSYKNNTHLLVAHD